MNPTASPTSKKKPRIGLTPLEEHRLRRRLRQAAPSEPWVDAQIKTLHDRAPGGDPIAYRFHDPQSFPPGGPKLTPMRWCHHCGRYTPPNSIHLLEHRPSFSSPIISSTLQCDDCRIAADDTRYHELYDAGLYLRPLSSNSFVRMADLLKRSK
jgi:hypothetical protein